MASRAILPEPPLVFVLVARAAARGKPHPCVVQILACQQRPRLRGNVLRAVACTATNSHMFPIERISGLRVVKSLRRRRPVDHLETLAVVI